MATHDDFSTAKFRIPVAIYCGSIPRSSASSGFRTFHGRNRNINSSLQDHAGQRTGEDEASPQSLLKVQMEKQGPVWGRNGDLTSLKASKAWQSRNGYVKNVEAVSSGPHPLLPATVREMEANSAALETTQIKDKLKKRRLSEGLSASPRASLDAGGVAKGASLKSAIPLATSQRLLVASRPMPPIQSIPTTPEIKGSLENGSGPQGSSKGQLRATPAAQEVQISLQYLHCKDEKMKQSLGGTLIPPILKAGQLADTKSVTLPAIVSNPSPVPPGQDVFTLQEVPGIGLVQENSPQKRTPKSREARPTVPPVRATPAGGTKSAVHSSHTASPLMTPSFSHANKDKQLKSQQLLKEVGRPESSPRILVTIAKSAQEKMRLKQMKEMELFQRVREREERQQERDLLSQSLTSRSMIKEGLIPLHGSGSLSVSAKFGSPCRTSLGIILKKRANRSSLPSIPVVHQGPRFTRHASANSLPAVFTVGSPEWEEEDRIDNSKEPRPVSNSELVLMNAFQWLESNDWQMKQKGLLSIRRLAICHSEVLAERLHDVSLAVMREVTNLRSKVSRLAISTLGDLFCTMKKNMDPEAEEVARCLLQKMGDTSEFIQTAADRSLGAMVENVTPSRSLAALTTGGVHHRNPLVRKCTAEHLCNVVEQIGAEKLLSGTRDSTDTLIRILVKLAQDSNKETRLYGRKMINSLMSSSRFDAFLKQSLPSHDLCSVMATIKQKGVEESIEPPPIRGRKILKTITISEEVRPSEQGCSSENEPAMIQRASTRHTEMAEQLKELNSLLQSKEYRARMEGITLLLVRCKNSQHFITTNLTQIFDAFIPRLQDPNKKVNQCALEIFTEMIPHLKDNLHPVLVSVVTAVSDNLNSKSSPIYGAAVMALDAMIENIDNFSLLQAFAGRLCFLSGRAMCDITQRLSVLVTSVYSCKPQGVERHVLPVLWYFLNNMIGNGVLPGHSGNVRSVVCLLTKSLYEQMGTRLQDCAAGQPKQVSKMLQEILDSDFQ